MIIKNMLTDNDEVRSREKKEKRHLDREVVERRDQLHVVLDNGLSEKQDEANCKISIEKKLRTNGTN